MMTVLAYLIVAFAAIRFLVAVSNVIFRPILRNAGISGGPFLSILIPARNEENNIRNLLNDLLAQDYTRFEIIVFNDQSADHTAEIVEEFRAVNKKIQLINSYELPDGWLGKNYACHCLAKQAKGEYYLFLDADVRIGNGLIESTLAHQMQHKLDLLSIFPRQIMISKGERIVVPIMNTVLLSLLPLFLVRRSKYASLSAANGQFMLFSASVYSELLPHERMKDKKAEDISIARFLKSRRYRVDCLTGNSTISCRMYTDFKEAVLGFTKNIASFFGGNFFLASLFWLITTFGVFIVFFQLKIFIFLLYLAFGLITGILVSFISLYRISDHMLYLVPRQLSFGLVLMVAIKNNLLKQSKWKGRNIN